MSSKPRHEVRYSQGTLGGKESLRTRGKALDRAIELRRVYQDVQIWRIGDDGEHLLGDFWYQD